MSGTTRAVRLPAPGAPNAVGAPGLQARGNVDGTNIRPGDEHMKRVVLTFQDADHHEEAWTSQGGGPEAASLVFRFIRKK